MFERTLKPIISLFDKLSFKKKLIISISSLFILLIMPSISTFENFTKKYQIYSQESLGLEYLTRLHHLSLDVQLHRGLLNTYLSGKESLKNRILEAENHLTKDIVNFIEFDKQKLNYLSHDKNFINALVNIDIVKLKNIEKKHSLSKLFQTHTQVIKDISKALSTVSSKTNLLNNSDDRVKYIANLLVSKIFTLEDSIGQIRGLSSGIFERKKMTQEEKNKLLALYTIVKSIQDDLKENQILVSLENFHQVQTSFLKSLNQTNYLLEIINNKLFIANNFDYDSKEFFALSSKILDEVSKLFDTLTLSYIIIINEQYQDLQKNILLLTIGFIAIILTSIYLFTALFKSIAKSLKKLQFASKLISEGKTDIHVEVDTKDEIGEALHAFNDMSAKLAENISFLDGYKMAIDETSIVSKTDPRGIITYANKMFCDISGYKYDELIGMSHNIVRHPDMPKETFQDLWHTIKKEKKIWEGIVKNRKKDGGYYIVDATIIPVFDSHGEVVEYIGVRHDVTELEDSKEEIRRQKIDLLTSLPNRASLLDDMQNLSDATLFLFDIDEFSSLNDFYGSKMGDSVLHFVKDHLKDIQKRIESKLYRVDADKFALLIKDRRVTKENYKALVSDIIEYVESEAVKCDSSKCVSITLRAGVVFSTDGHLVENLLSFANLASKSAKEYDKKYLRYTDKINKEKNYQKNMEWINKIKSAIKEDRIITYFQPIIDNKSEAITKYETLVRLKDRDGKFISPFFFLDIAKKAKLYSQITKIVIDKAFAKFSKNTQYEFSLNLTIEDIQNQEITSYILQKLKSFPQPQRVVFEIVESEKIESYEEINSFIKEVKRFGVKIAIDDFGSGYANFEHIVKLQADYIKIDGSLIKDITTDKNSHIVTEAIIAFSKKLGTKTIVEYVHNKEVYETVKRLGADFSQGFYLGEPKKSLVGMTFKNIA